MLRVACSAVRPVRASYAANRTFVSSVLLSKTYDDKTVAELRAELRSRSLPSSGSKATLITRIQKSDVERLSSDPSPVLPSPLSQVAQQRQQQPATRTLSTSSSLSEPVQATYESSRTPNILDIKLPDLSQPTAEEPVQIPFLPDAWNSYAIKAETKTAETEPQAPKIMLAAGVDTHPAGGPTFAMSSANDTLLPEVTKAQPPRKLTGVVGDILEDLGVSEELFTPAMASVPAETTPVKKTLSRPLDEAEKKGVYYLLGLVAGSWILAGIAAPS